MIVAIVSLNREQAGQLRPDQHEELCDWVRELGVDPKDVRPALVVEHGERGYRLHLSEYVRDKDGRLIVDHALNDVVSQPLVVELGTVATWPSWLRNAGISTH